MAGTGMGSEGSLLCGGVSIESCGVKGGCYGWNEVQTREACDFLSALAARTFL